MTDGLPRYVTHDGETWRVASWGNFIDGDPGYELIRSRGPGKQPMRIDARVTECVPVPASERVRKFRDGGIVLEMNTRGQCYVRKAGSRKRYETSLEAIFSMTVKAHVAMAKALKAAAKRRGKR